MAKPRVFVSSTYYDLRHIRDRLEVFIESLGYEGVLFESGDIPFRHDRALDESCYAEIQLCHILVLLIGGRYGSAASSPQQLKEADRDGIYNFYNSITRQEYETARERDIPIFIFVEKNVLAEYETYKHNKDAHVRYAHVDSKNIFALIDDILSRQRNNFVRGFERFDDVANWLRDQWAGLFAEMISRRSSELGIKDLASRINELGGVASTLKTYTETLLRQSEPESAAVIIDNEDRKLQLRHLKQFQAEPMIDFLTRNVFKEKKSAAKLFDAFQRSTSVEEFLGEAGLDPKKITEFMDTHRQLAEQDYKRIREKQVNVGDLTDDDDLMGAAEPVAATTTATGRRTRARKGSASAKK